MASMPAEQYATIEEAALKTLIKRVRTINTACDHLDFAYSQIPLDGKQPQVQTANYAVATGSTPTDDPKADLTSETRKSLSQIYDAMGSKA